MCQGLCPTWFIEDGVVGANYPASGCFNSCADARVSEGTDVDFSVTSAQARGPQRGKLQHACDLASELPRHSIDNVADDDALGGYFKEWLCPSGRWYVVINACWLGSQ